MRHIAKLIAAVTVLGIASPSGAMSPEKAAQLQKLLQERSVEVLGKPPVNFGGLKETRRLDSPPVAGKRCRVVSKKHDRQSAGTYQRWYCE